MSSAVRYQVMPPLSSEEYQDLYESIKSDGVLEPIHVDEEGVVIDGHHRSKIASELGVPCPVITHDDLDEAGKVALAFVLNLKRRHLSREQRESLVIEYKRRLPMATNREVAKAAGVHHETVKRISDDAGLPGRDELISEAVALNPEKSNREIARELGVSDKTVGAVRGAENGGNRHSPQAKSPTATSIPQSELDELNEVEEVRPVFQAPGEPNPEQEQAPAPIHPIHINRDLEAQARAKSSAPNSGAYVTGESPGSRNAKRFEALALARTILKETRELAGMISDTGGITGMENHLQDIMAALEVATEANKGAGIDDAINNLLK